MSLLSALNSAQTGILAAQAQIDVASRNISNASTPGYTRKIQEQSSRVIDGRSGMVVIEEVQRNINLQLQRDVLSQTALTERLNVIEGFLGRFELQFGRPEDDSSLASKITQLKDTFQALATNPDQQTAQSDVLRAAEELALSFNSLSQNIQDLRQEADIRIESALGEVQEALTNIGSLNAEIAARQASGQSTADLLDQRDVWVAQLSENMDIRTFERPDGRLAVMTGSSQFLLDQDVPTINFTPSGIVGPDQALGAITITDDFGGITDITASISQGKIGGLLDLRDTILPEAQDQIDSLAFEVATQFDSFTIGGNVAVVQLFTAPPLTTPNPAAAEAVPTNDQGYSAIMQVRSTIVGTELRDGDGTGTFVVNGDGDASLTLAVLDMFETKQAFVAVNGLNTTASTLEEFGAQFIGYQANQKADFESQYGFQDEVRNLLNERLLDQSGVNIDEELANLIQLESAFSASARVLSSVQRAMDELLDAVR